MNWSRARVLGWLVGGVVLVAVVAGLYLLGPPAEERARRLDERRVEHLASIGGAVNVFWIQHGRVPGSLKELEAAQPWLRGQLVDPSTGARYEYRPLDAPLYELCARFERESETGPVRPGAGPWAHGAGRHCFTREARQSY